MTHTHGKNGPPTLDGTRVRVLHLDPGELLVVRGDQAVTVSGPAAEQLGRHVDDIVQVVARADSARAVRLVQDAVQRADGQAAMQAAIDAHAAAMDRLAATVRSWARSWRARGIDGQTANEVLQMSDELCELGRIFAAARDQWLEQGDWS